MVRHIDRPLHPEFIDYAGFILFDECFDQFNCSVEQDRECWTGFLLDVEEFDEVFCVFSQDTDSPWFLRHTLRFVVKILKGLCLLID